MAYMNKNRFAAAALLTVLLAVLGCGRLNPLSGGKSSPSGDAPKTGSTPAAGSNVPSTSGTTTGIAECDEAIEIINREANNPDDNFVTKAIKSTILDRVKDEIKRAIDENKGKQDKEEMTKTCRELRDNLVKSLAEQQQKSKE